MGFLRHITTGLIYIKKSTIFANSTLMILIPSVRFIPSMVAPQQSHSPFFLTRKDSEIFNDTVQFTLPSHTVLIMLLIYLFIMMPIILIFMIFIFVIIFILLYL